MKSKRIRDGLLAGVERRREEIGQAILARVHAVSGVDGDLDAEYLEGVRSAVETAIDHTIRAAGIDDDSPLPVPGPLLAQSRLAARRRTPLDRVLRRYLAGHSVLSDFIIEEAGNCGASPEILRQVLRSQAAETDRVVGLISEAYRQEAESLPRSSTSMRLSDRIRRLLAGELIDPTCLGYELDRWHIGLVAQGPGREEAVHAIASRFDAARLVVAGDEELLWAWMGLRTSPAMGWSAAVSAAARAEGAEVGIGEPGKGRIGWRLTHEQARAALTVIARGGARAARYSDVALLATAIRDELLTRSLRALYMEPLDDSREGGRALRETLRTYLEADRNVTSTAAALGVSRNTVHNRLRMIEKRIGPLRPPHSGDLGLALQLEVLVSNCPVEKGFTQQDDKSVEKHE